MSQLNIPSLATASPTVWHFVLWLHLSWYFHVHFPHIIVTFHPIAASRPFGTHVLMFSYFYFSHLWHFIPMPHFFLLCDILPIHGCVCLGLGGGGCTVHVCVCTRKSWEICCCWNTNEWARKTLQFWTEIMDCVLRSPVVAAAINYSSSKK